MLFRSPSTVLFEVFRDVDRSLTLAVASEIETRTVYSHRPTMGRPLAFSLEIQRVLEGKPISLETDLLSTFVGESVSYSFDLGGPDAESVRVQLTPLRIVGEIIEIDAQISGKLPDEDDLEVALDERRIVVASVPNHDIRFFLGFSQDNLVIDASIDHRSAIDMRLVLLSLFDGALVLVQIIMICEALGCLQIGRAHV